LQSGHLLAIALDNLLAYAHFQDESTSTPGPLSDSENDSTSDYRTETETETVWLARATFARVVQIVKQLHSQDAEGEVNVVDDFEIEGVNEGEFDFEEDIEVRTEHVRLLMTIVKFSL
jgi:hypothetical protein